MNKQISLSNPEDELSQVRVPWNEWTAMIKPCYYKGACGNKPYDLELMLRLYLIQNLRVIRHKALAFLSTSFSASTYIIITF